MKILHVVPTYLPAYRYGGPIQSVHALNKHLVRQGAEVAVYTTAIDGPENLKVDMLKPVMVDGVKVHYFRPGFPRKWFYAPGMRRGLRENAHRFDLIHATSVFLSASTLAAGAGERAHKPFIISPRGSLMRAPLQKKSSLRKKLYLDFVEKNNLAHAAAVHFTTELEKKEYLEQNLPLRQGLVIPNGLDTEALPPGNGAAFRTKYGIRPEEKVVLFLSRLSWKKGLDTLIDAFAGLAKEMPEAVLVIAGGDDENYRGEVEASVAGHDLVKRVVFTGELSGEERSAAYAAADVFCLPSYAENFGIVVAEAMHFGVPVVITEAVGIAPQVSASGAGFIVKKDVLEVKFALHKILKSKVAAREMGEKGKELVARAFSYEAVARRFLEAYTQLIRKPWRNSP